MAYPKLGLAPGQNYIWRDTTDAAHGKYRALIVPRNTAYPMRWMAITRKDETPPSEPVLHLQALAYLGCDLFCDSGHCSESEAAASASTAQLDSIRIR